MFKRILSITLPLSVVLPTYSFASGEAAGIPPMPGKGYFGIDANPAFLNKFTTPHLTGKEVDASRVIQAVKNCKSMKDLGCAKSNYFSAGTMFPLCESIAELIKSNLETTKKSGLPYF
jgi:hypothetical protein